MGPVGRVPPNFGGPGDQGYLVPPNFYDLLQVFQHDNFDNMIARGQPRTASEAVSARRCRQVHRAASRALCRTPVDDVGQLELNSLSYSASEIWREYL